MEMTDIVTLELLGRDGRGDTLVERVNKMIATTAALLMRDNMGPKGSINIKIDLKRIANGVNVVWTVEDSPPNEVRPALMAFVHGGDLVTQDTRQPTLPNVAPIRGPKNGGDA